MKIIFLILFCVGILVSCAPMALTSKADLHTVYVKGINDELVAQFSQGSISLVSPGDVSFYEPTNSTLFEKISYLWEDMNLELSRTIYTAKYRLKQFFSNWNAKNYNLAWISFLPFVFFPKQNIRLIHLLKQIIRISFRILFIGLIFLNSFPACTNQRELCNRTYEAESLVESCNLFIGYNITNNSNFDSNPNAGNIRVLFGILLQECLKAYEQKRECDRKSEYIPALNW